MTLRFPTVGGTDGSAVTSVVVAAPTRDRAGSNPASLALLRIPASLARRVVFHARQVSVRGRTVLTAVSNPRKTGSTPVLTSLDGHYPKSSCALL